MKTFSQFLVFAFLLAFSVTSPAADNGKFSKELPTQMADRGKLLLSDDFSGSAIDPRWKMAKGKWELVNGALKGVELKTDDHAAVIRTPVSYHNAIIQITFKFDGGKQFSISLNNQKGHVCRAIISPTKLSINKDKANKQSVDKPERLGDLALKLQPGQWYEMTLEVQGAEILASLGKDQIIHGENAGIDIDKSDVGLPVGGEGVSFGYVRVWEATPKAGWDKSKLRAQK